MAVPHLEQVWVEHGPDHQLLHQPLGLLLARDVIPLHMPPLLHNLIAHQLQHCRLHLLKGRWKLPIRACHMGPGEGVISSWEGQACNLADGRLVGLSLFCFFLLFLSPIVIKNNYLWCCDCSMSGLEGVGLHGKEAVIFSVQACCCCELQQGT